MSTEGGTKAVLAAAAANTFIALSKFVAWGLTGASSMLAEAIHSLADTGNQALLLLGGRAAKKDADDAHPFGYGRERYLSAFMVAIILFSVGGIFAIYEAFHKYEETKSGHPNELLDSGWWWVPLVVLGGSIIAESLSLRTALKESKAARGNKTIYRFVRTSRSPELPVVLMEDIAALAGLVFALVGVSLTLLTHNAIYDVIGTGMIGLLLIAVAVLLAVETKSMLIGESASPAALEKIRGAIKGTPQVEKLIHMKTLHLGPDEILVAAKIGIAPTTQAADLVSVIDAAEVAIRAAVPQVTQIYLEPDFYRDDYVPASRGGAQ